MKTIKLLKYAAIALILILVLGLGFIYSGVFPVGADNKHNALTFWAIETLRTQSIVRASKYIEVPSLSEPQLLLSGGADYNDMCSGCHMKPGQKESDLSIGLYPKPPNLTLASKDHAHAHEQGDHNDPNVIAQQQFWVIKHGIMASGMAAYGPTHDDDRIWAIVAFLQKLPELNEMQYQILTARQ
jgi:mono/diheme cytochrome c family protein